MKRPSHCQSLRHLPWLFVPLITAGLAAQDEAAAAVQKRIAEHFEKVVPELSRYRGTTTYGETLSASRPGEEALRVERDLFTAAMATSAATTLPVELVQLGHNLVVFEPTFEAPAATERPMTRAYLQALHAAAPTGSEQLRSALFFATVAADELGEQVLVGHLGAEPLATRTMLAQFLANAATHASSVGPIEQRIAVEPDVGVRAMLVRSLAMIGMLSSAKVVRDLAANAKDDEVQAAAIFACVEIEGFPATEFLSGLAPAGEQAKQALRDGLDYLRTETSAASKHGREVANDSEFVMRFADLRSSPTMAWLGEVGRLDEAAVEKGERLSDEHKQKLFELLVDSKGFGLEAVKGALFASLAKADEPKLLRVRAAGMASPNQLAIARMRTIGIMLRHVRQDV